MTSCFSSSNRCNCNLQQHDDADLYKTKTRVICMRGTNSNEMSTSKPPELSIASPQSWPLPVRARSITASMSRRTLNLILGFSNCDLHFLITVSKKCKSQLENPKQAVWAVEFRLTDDCRKSFSRHSSATFLDYFLFDCRKSFSHKSASPPATLTSAGIVSVCEEQRAGRPRCA